MENTNKKFHYGWIVALLSLMMVVCSTLFSSGMSISLAGVRNAFNLTGTQTSMFITVRSISAFLIVMVMDQWFGKLGLRKGITVGLFIGVVGMALFAVAGSNLPLYYVGSALGGITYGLCMMVAASMLMKNWFNAHRTLCLGICSAGTGVSNMIFSPILQMIINNYGIRQVFMFQAVLFTVVAVLIFLLVRDKPEDMGLEPVGGKDYVAGGSKKDNQKKEAYQHKVYLGTTSILIMSVFIVGLGMSASPVSSHMALCFNAAGIDPMLIATAASMSGFLLIVGKLSYGYCSDRIGPKLTSVIFTIIACIGYGSIFMLLFIPQSFMVFIAYAGHGIGGSVCSLGYPVWAMDFSSPEDYPKTLKKFQLGYQLGTLIGSPIPGIIADATGSYCWYYIVAVICFGAMTAYAMVCYRQLARMRRAAGEPV